MGVFKPSLFLVVQEMGLRIHCHKQSVSTTHVHVRLYVSTVEPLHYRRHWNQIKCPDQKGVLVSMHFSMYNVHAAGTTDIVLIRDVALFRRSSIERFHHVYTHNIVQLLTTSLHTNAHNIVHVHVIPPPWTWLVPWFFCWPRGQPASKRSRRSSPRIEPTKTSPRKSLLSLDLTPDWKGSLSSIYQQVSVDKVVAQK